MSTASHYNRVRYKKINKYRKEAILSFAQKENIKILDIGCSSGEMGEYIKENKNAIVYGIDISSRALKEAEKKLDKVFLIDLSKKMEDIPEALKGVKFDYIIISEVLEHLFSPENLIDNVKKIISKDTEVIITVPNVLFWKNRLKILFGKFEYSDTGLMDRGHIHFFTWKSLERLVDGAGFEIIDVNNHIPTRGTKKLGKIFPGLFAFQFILKIKYEN